MNSLATKLTTYVLTLTLLILGVTCVIMYRFNSAEVRHHAEKYAAALMDNTIKDMSWNFKDVEDVMTAHERQVQAVINQPDSLMALIKSIVIDNKLIMGTSVAYDNTDLMLYVYTDTAYSLKERILTDKTTYNYHQKYWYLDAKNTGKKLWSEPYYDNGCGDRLMTTYSVPIYDANGDFRAVFTADVSLLELDKEINAMRSFDDDFTFVLSGKGNYVAHSKWSTVDGTVLYNVSSVNDGKNLIPIYKKMLAGEKGLADVSIYGNDMLVCYAPLMLSDWSICYVCPYDSILASLNSFTASTEGFLLVLLLLLIAAMWVIIKRQIRPAEKLTEATYAISKGDFNSKLPEIKTKDEFKRLHDAFEVMQVSLKNYIADLTAITEAKQKIQSELRIAHDIQMHLIPRIVKDSRYPHLKFGALLRPAKEVGGDYYDYLFIDNKLYFTIADVSGKGVPAALIMATTRAHFRMICSQVQSPSKIVAALNDVLCVDNDANMFVTMFVGIIDLNSGLFSYCNAGHCPAVIVDNHTAKFLEVTPNLPLGVIQGFDFKEQSMDIIPGTVMLFYTDGLTEAENADHQMFGEERTCHLLCDATRLTPDDIVYALAEAVKSFAADVPQSDDLTLFSIKYNRILRMHNDLNELSRLYDFVDSCLSPYIQDEALRTVKTLKAQLALEEVLVNVINYAYPKDVIGDITLIAELNMNQFVFRLTDNGRQFNPTKVRKPNINAPLEEREIGGLGIHLVRNIMDSVSYGYVNGRNELTMYFNLQ